MISDRTLVSALAGLMLVLTLGTLGVAGGEPPTAPLKSLAAPAVQVPLKPHDHALMVEATLNHKVSGTFVLDTGATYTSISRDLAEALGLDLVNCDHVLITTANGRIEVPKVVIREMTVNGLTVNNVEATVIDVRKGSSFSGLMGLSFLRQFRLTIDPEQGVLLFQPHTPVQVTTR